MPKAIIFDVDGTLLDSEKIYMQAWREAGKLFGYDIPQIALKETRAVSIPVAKECFRRHCGQDFPYDEMRNDRVRISEQLFQTCEPEQLRMPGVQEALNWVTQQGYSIAVASTTELEKTRAHLEHAQLLHFFPVVVCGDMVSRGKPAPDIFLLAAQKLGVDPKDCVVVGDTPADVFAAHAAGIPMILVPDQVAPNDETTPLCRKIISGLDQLPEALQAL